MIVSIEQYRQRVGSFNSKSKNIFTRSSKLDSVSLLLEIILFISSMIQNLTPHYICLFQLFYQKLLPNVDNITIKILNETAKKFNKKPFLESGLKANLLGPEFFLFLCTLFLPSCNDPIELSILTLLLLVITPLLVSWSVFILHCLFRVLYNLTLFLNWPKSLKSKSQGAAPFFLGISFLFFSLRKASPRKGLFHFFLNEFVPNAIELTITLPLWVIAPLFVIWVAKGKANKMLYYLTPCIYKNFSAYL